MEVGGVYRVRDRLLHGEQQHLHAFNRDAQARNDARIGDLHIPVLESPVFGVPFTELMEYDAFA